MLDNGQQTGEYTHPLTHLDLTLLPQSIDFHEKGRRHQENVRKKLRNITKSNTQFQKHTNKVDATIKQMESAAMEAYKKDIEVHGDLSASLMKQQMSGVTKLWNEVRTRDGRTEYVNVMTKGCL